MSVIADAYLAGVSTRRVEKLVQQLGVERMSKSQVSRLAKSLDQIVEDFRTRPLDGAPYAYVTLDALVVKCREGGRTVNVCVVHAVGVNKRRLPRVARPRRRHRRGRRRLARLRPRPRRARPRRREARQLGRPPRPRRRDRRDAARRAWQRCRTHFMRNLLTRVPKSAQGFVATMVRTIFAQPDADDRARAARAGSSTSSRALPRSGGAARRGRPPTCSPSPASRRSTGGSSGATTRSSGSTKRSAAAPTSSASSPTAPRSSASSAPCSPNRTTNGPSPAAT